MSALMKTSEPDSKISLFSEFAGCTGNFGTVLPLLFAVSVASGMNLSLMLLWAAIWYVISGVYYKIPVPIEPFKAVGAIAIAEHISSQIIAASGIITGALCLLIGMFGFMDRIQKIIPQAVIRGVQLGLAFIFIRSAIQGFILPDLTFGIIAGIIIAVFFLLKKYKNITDYSSLLIITAGFGFAIFIAGFHGPLIVPVPALVIPDLQEFYTAAIVIVPAQIPLTLTNAVLATSLLISDLFKRDENPDKLSKTIGIMSITSSILGGFPMCHGAGGLAAHFRFGARGGLSMIFGGVILAFIAFICAYPDIVAALPRGMFGILLIAVAIELIRHAIKTNNQFVTAIIGVLALPFGLAIAFFAGLITAWVITYKERASKN